MVTKREVYFSESHCYLILFAKKFNFYLIRLVFHLYYCNQ